MKPKIDTNEKSVIEVDPLDPGVVIVTNTSGEKKSYNCDKVFNVNSTQADVSEIF